MCCFVPSELVKSLGKSEERLKRVSRERDELEAAIDQFRGDLARVEQSKKELSHQVRAFIRTDVGLEMEASNGLTRMILQGMIVPKW